MLPNLYTFLKLNKEVGIIGMSLLVYVEVNISAPELVGPIYNDTEFYFICRIEYTGEVEVGFDVTLLFDGELIPGVAFKTVFSAVSFEVVFTSQDFTGQYGKWVCQPSLTQLYWY